MTRWSTGLSRPFLRWWVEAAVVIRWLPGTTGAITADVITAAASEEAPPPPLNGKGPAQVTPAGMPLPRIYMRKGKGGGQRGKEKREMQILDTQYFVQNGRKITKLGNF